MAIPNIEVEPGAKPEIHELDAAEALSQYGKVKFLKPANANKVKTPDILWLGEFWELKSPKGYSGRLFEKTIRRAVHQSANIIIDLQRIKMVQERCIGQIERQAKLIRGVKKLKVITKTKDPKTELPKIIDIK